MGMLVNHGSISWWYRAGQSPKPVAQEMTWQMVLQGGGHQRSPQRKHAPPIPRGDAGRHSCPFSPPLLHLCNMKDLDTMTFEVTSGTKVICACIQEQYHSTVWVRWTPFREEAYLPSGSLKVNVINLLATMNMKITQKHAANRSHWWCMLSNVSHSVILPGKQKWDDPGAYK